MSIIHTQNITKRFQYVHEQNNKFAALFFARLTSKRQSREVLHPLTIQVDAGEVVALVGNNGAGKTTVLKVLAGLYTPTTGTMTVPSSLLYLGGSSAGFPPRLTVREAVYYIGLLLGLSRDDVHQKYDTVITFAELNEYEHVRIFQLSRGMTHRLYFSVITHLSLAQEPDVVLLDEVFSQGGDIAFRQKTEEKVAEYVKKGSTILFASHNLALVERHARRIWWFENGLLKMDGKTTEVLDAYKAFVGFKK